jgi:hypothetical protein
MSDAPDPFEFLKTFWTPMGLPMGGLATPTLSVSEVEKRIADLKLVENWLTMNLSMLRMTLQGLEMQKMALNAMQAGLQGAAPGAASQQNAALEAWPKLLQGGLPQGGPAPQDPGKTK